MKAGGMLFYRFLLTACLESGVGLSDMAEACGISKENLRQWKNGIWPSGHTVIRIANYLGVTTDRLLKGQHPITARGAELLRAWEALPFNEQMVVLGDAFRRREAAAKQRPKWMLAARERAM